MCSYVKRYNRGTVRVEWGYTQGTVGVQSAYSRGTVRVQQWNSQGRLPGIFFTFTIKALTCTNVSARLAHFTHSASII